MAIWLRVSFFCACISVILAPTAVSQAPQKGDRGFVNHPSAKLYNTRLGDGGAREIGVEYWKKEAGVEVLEDPLVYVSETWLKIRTALVDGSVVNGYVEAQYFSSSPWTNSLVRSRRTRPSGSHDEYFYDTPSIEMLGRLNDDPQAKLYAIPTFLYGMESLPFAQKGLPLGKVRTKKPFLVSGHEYYYVETIHPSNGIKHYGIVDPRHFALDEASTAETSRGGTPPPVPSVSNWVESMRDRKPSAARFRERIEASRRARAGADNPDTEVENTEPRQGSRPGATETEVAARKPESPENNAEVTLPQQNAFSGPAPQPEKPPDVRDTKLFTFVYKDWSHKVASTGKTYVFPARTLLHALSDDGRNATYRMSDGGTIGVTYTSGLRYPIHKFNWDHANQQATGRAQNDQYVRRYIHGFMLMLHHASRIGMIVLFVSVILFAMIAGLGSSIILDEEDSLRMMLSYAGGAFAALIPLVFFGSIQGGFFSEYLDSYGPLNAGISQSIRSNEVILPFKINGELPAISNWYTVNKVVYVPYLLFCNAAVLYLAWPFFVGAHFLVVPHPAERKLKRLIRMSRPNKDEIRDVLSKMTSEEAVKNPPPAYASRNQARKMAGILNRIKKENAVLEALLSLYRKKHELSERKNDG